MKFEDIKDRQILWPVAVKERNRIMFVLQKGQNAVTVAWYSAEKDQLMRTTIYRDEWTSKSYVLRYDLKPIIDVLDNHKKNIIEEVFESLSLALEF